MPSQVAVLVLVHDSQLALRVVQFNVMLQDLKACSDCKKALVIV
nr:MAG TPA: Transcription elongation factor SPT5, Transcription-protein complex, TRANSCRIPTION [Caudoviricetes sp.]